MLLQASLKCIRKKTVWQFAQDSSILRVAERLQVARMVRGYRSRRLFASRFGLSVGTYSAHETGVNQMSVKMATQYCEILGISIQWLLSGKGSPLVRKIVSAERKVLKKFGCLVYLMRTGKVAFL